MEITPAELFSSRTPAESINTVSADVRTISPAPVVFTAKLPVPVLTVTLVAPVTLPMVIARAPAPVPMFTAPVDASEARFRAVAPVVMVADPLRVANPDAASVVKDPAAAAVPPIAGGDAKTAAKFDGVTK